MPGGEAVNATTRAGVSPFGEARGASERCAPVVSKSEGFANLGA
jgi:hypothetical protein